MMEKFLFVFLAFHDAIGDVIALSVSTPKHLQTLGLVQKSIDDVAHDINFLFSLAMDKVNMIKFHFANSSLIELILYEIIRLSFYHLLWPWMYGDGIFSVEMWSLNITIAIGGC